MAADAGSVRFFFDESVLGLGKVMALARKDVIHAGHPLIPEVPLGTLDPDWIPHVCGIGLVIVCRDKKIRTRPVELEALSKHGARVVWQAGKKDLGIWDQVHLMVTRWGDVERIVEDRPTGPWFMALSASGLKEIAL